ncbi:hypothetical protein [uncultured Hydrogenophaga sp.]|uniref:hypothetical protein n=1 Tax=uncultured Hydrogenophaga sp. TaxID=199683 RepID=UPI0026603683|nr:hypothetical protein [uncultured Hydrogenophaga sp.]
MTEVSDFRSGRATGWADHIELLREVARFNLCLATPQVAAGWAIRLGMVSSGQPWPVHFWSSLPALADISAAMLSTLQHQPCFESRSPAWPLALLPDEELPGFGRLVSAALMHRVVRQTLSRQDVLHWRDWLKPTAWRFAMEGAALLPGLPPTPDVDVATVGADAYGQAWLWQASGHWDPAIAERWRLRHELPVAATVRHIPPEVAHRTAMTVLSAVQPRWFSRFAR